MSSVCVRVRLQADVEVALTSAELAPSGSIIGSCDSNGSIQLFASSARASCNNAFIEPVLPSHGPIVNPDHDRAEDLDLDTAFGEAGLVIAPTYDGALDVLSTFSEVRGCCPDAQVFSTRCTFLCRPRLPSVDTVCGARCGAVFFVAGCPASPGRPPAGFFFGEGL